MMFGRGQRTQQKRKCKAKLIQLNISLEDAYKGAMKTVEYEKRCTCKKCHGTGAADPSANIKCGSCGGQGVKLITQRMGSMLLQTQQTCEVCSGEGTVIKTKCKECKGEKVHMVKKKKEVHLDKGVPDAHRYTFTEEGDEYPDILTGDLYIEIFLNKHKDFVRKGADLIYKVEISLLQALSGLSFDFKHLDGKKIQIKTKHHEIIKPGQMMTVHSLGMPFFNSPARHGNLNLEFDIIFPDKLNNEEAKKISEILHNHRLNNIPHSTMTDTDTEIYTMSDYNQAEENTHHSGGQKGGSDDEEEEAGYHKSVSCPNQ